MLLALLLLLLASCSESTPTRDEEPYARCETLHFGSVSPVNAWPSLDPEKLALDLTSKCHTLLEIEGLPWNPPHAPYCDHTTPSGCTNPYRAERRRLLQTMSAHKVTVFINSMNANAYGPKLWSEDMWRNYIKEIREDTYETGADVWLGGPSEPWAWNNPKAERFTRIARLEWPGTFVLADLGANHPTGRPYFAGIPYDYLEVHPCNVDDALDSLRLGGNRLTVTDCTPVIASHLNQATTDLLFATAAENGMPLIIYGHDTVQ